MSLRLQASFATFLLLLSGCSLVKLSDDIAQANCNDDADCEVLNDRGAKDFDPCELWQCNPTTDLCEFFPLDNDHDRFTPMTVTVDGDEIMCEVKVDKQDCDDDNAQRLPGGAERCDDLDNDCDQSIDEGVLVPKDDVAVMFNGLSADGAGDISYAIDPGTGAVALGYSINRSPNNVPGFSVLKNDLPAGTAATAVEPADSARVLFADSVGVGALGAGKFAMAFYNRSGQRLVAGTISAGAGDAPVLQATPEMMSKGLSCRASESCGMFTQQAQTPALAAIGDDVVVSYVRAPNDPGFICKKKSDAVTSNALLANLLTVSADGLDEVTPEAVEIGTTSLLEAPAVLGIMSLGWLVAYVDEDGAIVVKHVARDGDTLKPSAALLTLSDKDARHSGVRLTLGAKDGDHYSVGLAFQRGCTVAARVGMAVLDVRRAGDSATVGIAGEEVFVGGAPNETRPAIAYAKDRKVWSVVYRDTSGLRARFVDSGRNLLGDKPYDLLIATKSGNGARELLLSPVVVAHQSGGWFGALTYSQRAGSTSPNAVEAVTLASCGKKN